MYNVTESMDTTKYWGTKEIQRFVAFIAAQAFLMANDKMLIKLR